jgi:hypothetical protein
VLHRQLSVLLFAWLLSLCFSLSFLYCASWHYLLQLLCLFVSIPESLTTLQTYSVAVLRTVFLHHSNKNSILLSVVGSTLLIWSWRAIRAWWAFPSIQETNL